MFLLKFQAGGLVGCGILFYIQHVPTLHTFDGNRYPENKKYLKKRDDDVSWSGGHKYMDLDVFVLCIDVPT